MSKNNLLLIIIFLLGILLRIGFISELPVGVHADEADMGYAAYSLGKTGLSAYGTFNPLAFPEFNGGTHPPLYTYILIPLTKIFGLSIAVERMPAVFFGIGVTPIIYLLIKRLFRSESAALIGAFLYAVNPWSIFTSRQGLLESIAVFFVALGILLFLLAKNKPYFYILSAISFGFSLHSYDAPKIFVLPFVFLLIIYQWDFILKAKKQFLIFLTILIFSYSLAFTALFGAGQIQDFNRINILDVNQIEKRVNDERRYSNAPLWLSSVFHNKITVTFKTYTSSFFRPYSLSWFFVDGHGNLLESVGRQGQYYFFAMPFFFIGIYLAFKKNVKIGLLLISWFMIANIPGAITKGDFYPYRSILMLPVPIIFSALGIDWFLHFLGRKGFYGKIYILLSFLIGLVFISSFLFTYFFDYPIYASEWRYKQRNDALNYSKSISNNYKYVFVNGEVEWAIMYAYLNKVDPKEFQRAINNREKYKDIEVIKLGKYNFGSISSLKITTPSAYFPKSSIIVVDAGIYPEEPALKTFSGADPLNIIYKIILVK